MIGYIDDGVWVKYHYILGWTFCKFKYLGCLGSGTHYYGTPYDLYYFSI